jgi:hypothetical protein
MSIFEEKDIPELYSQSPDWFEYCFVYEKFVARGDLSASLKKPAIYFEIWNQCKDSSPRS